MNNHLYSCPIDANKEARKNAGFFGSKFDADGVPLGYTYYTPSDSERKKRADIALASWQSQQSAQGAHRLVKVSKSPTHEETGLLDESPFIELHGGRINLDSGEVIKEYKSESLTRAIFEHKSWSDEYRVRTQCEIPKGQQPPEQNGKRISKSLTLSGAKKIEESCRFVHKTAGGYTTFLTLTFDDAARERIENGASIQKEISRFWDAATKLWQRGWTEEYKGKIHKGEPHNEPLYYCWVVENPKNEDGEDNPHAHIMMRWRVPYRDFAAWAQRLERLWGQGFAHIEKIKEPEKAGAYMAKAAGYLTKGSKDSDQGTVNGNRYGISKPARAPGWELIESYDSGIMGSLIADVHDYFLHIHGSQIAKREWLKKKLDETPKEEKQQRQKIGKALEKIRSTLNDDKKLPIRPSKYSLTLVGVNAFRAFMNWAKDDTGRTNMAAWLPDKQSGVSWSENTPPSPLYIREFKRRIWAERMNRAKGACKHYWHSLMRANIPDDLNNDIDTTDFINNEPLGDIPGWFDDHFQTA